jgi:hypothetical protein
MLVFGGVAMIAKLLALRHGTDLLGITVGDAAIVGSLRAIGIGVGVLHLLAGLQAVRYRAGAPAWAAVYAVTAIVSTVAIWVVAFSYEAPPDPERLPRDGFALGLLVDDVIDSAFAPAPLRSGFWYTIGIAAASFASILWPIVVLLAMRRRATRDACVER